MRDDYQFEPFDYTAVLSLNNEGEKGYDPNDMSPENKAWQHIEKNKPICSLIYQERQLNIVI